MKIANNLYKVELKKSEDAVTGKIGLGWMVDSMRHFGLKNMISDEHGEDKRSNRQKDAYEKIMTGAMMMASGGQRIEDVENLRVDRGLLDSLGWEEMVCADTRKACLQAEMAGKRIAIFRSDSAGAQDKIFTYCAKKNIEWYVTMDKNEGVMKAVKKLKAFDWKTMYGRYEDQFDKQWAVTEYVVSKGYRVRILILRWKNPDPTLFDKSPYCYHVIGTNNRDIEPMEWLVMHNGRMGTIEQAHKELKTGFGCDYTPSHDFEKNRGYFLLGVLSYNMVQVMKLFYLGSDAVAWTIKTMRYQFINVCGKIIRSGRQFCCKIINVTKEAFERFKYCQMKMLSA